VVNCKSHIMDADDHIANRIKRIFRSYSESNITISMGDDRLNDKSSFNSVMNNLENLSVAHIENICEILGIQNWQPNWFFDETAKRTNVDFLCALTEGTYQANHLSPLIRQNNLFPGIDTHTSSSDVRYLCVTGAKNDKFELDSKPDCIHPHTPLFLEVKSRRRTNIEISENNLIQQENITNTELALFAQCLDRVIVQAQLRAYLSKIMVLASTGHHSYFFYYTQKCTNNTSKHLQVMRIDNMSVDMLWHSISRHVEQNPCWHMSEHAYHIIPMIYQLTDIDMHAVRVHYVKCSRSTVYYITLPSYDTANGKSNSSSVSVSEKEKTYAIKVNMNNNSFIKEADILREIYQKWSIVSDDKFYYLGDSKHGLVPGVARTE
jgi:hypothetical protein